MHTKESRVFSTFVLFSLCLHACSAKNLTCTVTLDDGRLVYNISEGSYASNAADCAFSWTNGTGIEHSATCTTDCISIEKQEYERFLYAVLIPLVAGVLGGIFLCGIVLCGLCYIFRVRSGSDFSALEMQDAGNP